MVNEEKVRLMTELARYEKKSGKKNFIINSYFMSDYVSRYMLGSFAAYTICYVFVFVLAVLYRFNDITNEPDIKNIVQMFRPYMVYYIIGLVVYEAIVVLVYAIRFRNGQREIRLNTARLKRLQKMQ